MCIAVKLSVINPFDAGMMSVLTVKANTILVNIATVPPPLFTSPRPSHGDIVTTRCDSTLLAGEFCAMNDR